MRRWSHGLAVAELAIAVMLTVGAGLLVRSWWSVQSVDPGLETDGVLTVAMNLPPGRFDTQARRDAFFAEAITRVRAIPGVTGAATISRLSMTVPSWTSDFAVAGREREEFGIDVLHREVSPGYHEVAGVRLLAGRAFTRQDDASSPPVVLINEALARRYFPNESPVGKRVAFDRYPDSTSFWRTIVGVVGSERQQGLEAEARPEIFAPVAQDENGPRTLVIRASVDPLSLIPAVRSAISASSPQVAVAGFRTLAAVRD